MEQSFELSGVHCMHCVARVKKALEPLCEKVEVTLSPAIAVVTVKEPLKIEDVNAALAKAGDYSATPLNSRFQHQNSKTGALSPRQF